MIDWSILNIVETNDEEIITQAYRRMLTVTNPEDNPEGFMLLRRTYEEALNYARNQQSMSSYNTSEYAYDNLYNGQGQMPMDNSNFYNWDNYAVEDEVLERTLYVDNKKSFVGKSRKEDINETVKLDIPLINKALKGENNQDEFVNNLNNDEYISRRETDNISVKMWINNVGQVYANFKQRISTDTWRELLNNPVCINLDSRMDATDEILAFLMNYYNLPQEIWCMIDETFGLKENKQELLERYPKEFIENVVISSIDYPDIINYKLFNTELQIDYDQFIGMYFDLVRSIRQGDMEEAYQKLVSIDVFGNVHPYVEVERVKYYINVGQLEVAAQYALMLYQQYPEDTSVIYIKAEIAWAHGNIDEAKSYYEKLLSINDKHYYAKLGLADCYMQEGDYEKAKDMYTMIRELNPFDSYVYENIELANNQLINYFVEKIKNDANDVRTKIKLAWCYLQKQDADNAILIGKEIEKMGDTYESCNILSRCYLGIRDYKNAIEYLEKWIACIRKVPHDGTTENKMKSERLGQAFDLLGQAYELAGKTKKALSLYKLAVKEEPNNISHKLNLARFQLELGKYEKCIEICDNIIQIEERNFGALYYRSVAYFKTDELVKALDGFDECIKIYKYDLNSYIYKIRILIKYCDYDKASFIIENLNSQGIDSDSIAFLKTKIRYDKDVIEEKNNPSDEEFDYTYYIDTYESLLNNYGKEQSDLDDPMPLYGEMANIYICMKEYKKALSILKIMKEKENNNAKIYEYMAICFEELGEFKAAIESYKILVTLSSENKETNIKIAKLYEEIEEYTEAIKYYSKEINNVKSVREVLDRGYAYLKIGNFDSARADFNEAIIMNQYEIKAYNYLGISYLYEDKYNEALEYFEKAINADIDKKEPLSYRYLAITYIRMNDFEKAIECYEKNIEIYDDSYDYEQIAILLYEQKRYKESVEIYTKKTKLDDNECSNIDLYIWVGKCNAGLESENTALKYYTKAIKEAKMIGLVSNKAYIEVAKMYMDIMKYDIAAKFFRQIKSKDVMTIENKIDYAYCCINAKSFVEAQNLIDNILIEINKISDKHIELLARKYYLLGYVYWVQGNYVKSNEYLEKVFKSNKCQTCKYKECHKALALKGLILEKTGDNSTAIKCMEDALKITPGVSRYIHEYNRMVDKYKH